ncbi:MAG: MnmC family methyltransferase [Cyanobacteria bacterium J06554_6]
MRPFDPATFTPILTGDGSSTFFSDEFGEWFHSREGAYAEAQQTYVKVTRLAELAKGNQLALLDVCYGLGYNSAAALETIWRVNPDCHVTLRALEIDLAVPQAAVREAMPFAIATQLVKAEFTPVSHAMRALAAETVCQTPTLDAQLLIGDARQQIFRLAGWLADAIFLDPFSPTRCPQLWTVEFLQQVVSCLKPTGRLATYSCAAAVRAALHQVGLQIGSTAAAGRQWPGTVASLTETTLPPLSQREQAHLQTRAAVPYRDPTLTATAAEIVAERKLRQQQSALESTGNWRRRWLS